MDARFAKLLTLAAAIVLAAVHASDLPLNDKVVEYCKENMGKKVGNGQCAVLAGAALDAAGAKKRDGPDFPKEADYVWGKLVFTAVGEQGHPRTTGNLHDVRPGDIVQYRDVAIGNFHFGHHTSVVAEVDASKMTIKVYQQNVNHKLEVMESLQQLSKLKEGFLRFYRPVKKDPPK